LKEEPLIRTLAATFFAFCIVGAAGIAEAKTHVVASGETLATIAQKEHVSAADIARINQLEGDASDHLVLGQVLALDETTALTLPPPAPIAPAAAAQLRSTIDTAGNPSAEADLAMWNAAPSDAHASPVKRFASRFITRASTIALNLTRSAMRFIGVPYVFGGTGSYGFDCSGYVQHVFALLGIHLPRTADAQYYAGRTTGGRILAGDLVFFQTYTAGPSHVGIYLGGGKFVHASSSRGVTVSRLRDSYWAARYLGAKRYVAAARAKQVTEATAL
jgi:cell wall-associated NlpC family hydrolase